MRLDQLPWYNEPGFGSDLQIAVIGRIRVFCMPDNVYRITAGAGDQFLISITGVRAYVITPCSPMPSTPICLGNAFASAGNPISVTTTFAGNHYIVVDHEAPAMQAAYMLTVTRQ